MARDRRRLRLNRGTPRFAAFEIETRRSPPIAAATGGGDRSARGCCATRTRGRSGPGYPDLDDRIHHPRLPRHDDLIGVKSIEQPFGFTDAAAAVVAIEHQNRADACQRCKVGQRLVTRQGFGEPVCDGRKTQDQIQGQSATPAAPVTLFSSQVARSPGPAPTTAQRSPIDPGPPIVLTASISSVI